MTKIHVVSGRTTFFIVLTVFVYFCGGTPLSATDKVGQRFEVRIEDLDQPFQTPSVGNQSIWAKRPAKSTLSVPKDFEVSAFAEGLGAPRWMTVAANGDVFLSEEKSDGILLLRDSDGDGVADVRSVYVSGLDQPHGLALHGGYLYIGEVKQVRRVPYVKGALEAPGPVETVTALGSLGDGGGHWTRNIVFGPDGKHFYVAVGSLTNRDVDAAPRATVQRFAIDGSNQETFASGLRNPVGIAFYPRSEDLYVVVSERDGLGDGLVPDYLTRVEEGGFYGWPFTYLGHFADPKYKDQEPGLAEKSLEPDVLFEAHSAPLGLVFYDASQFPKEYFGDAFVAFHGSWNASEPTGYKIVRIPFENGRPRRYYENFAVGFRADRSSWLDGVRDALRLGHDRGLKNLYRWVKSWFTGIEPARVWGRPAGLAIARDGSLLIADDAGGTVWRVSYNR